VLQVLLEPLVLLLLSLLPADLLVGGSGGVGSAGSTPPAPEPAPRAPDGSLATGDELAEPSASREEPAAEDATSLRHSALNADSESRCAQELALGDEDEDEDEPPASALSATLEHAPRRSDAHCAAPDEKYDASDIGEKLESLLLGVVSREDSGPV
jgi:hypothetical protein